jgi:hypothetical protein
LTTFKTCFSITCLKLANILTRKNKKQGETKFCFNNGTIDLTSLKGSNCFICKVMIILTLRSQAYDRAKITSVNLSHARKKRGEKNQSHLGPSLRL